MHGSRRFFSSTDLPGTFQYETEQPRVIVPLSVETFPTRDTLTATPIRDSKKTALRSGSANGTNLSKHNLYESNPQKPFSFQEFTSEWSSSSRIGASPMWSAPCHCSLPPRNATAAMKSSSRRIRYAVVGLGHIAQIAVLPAFAHAKNSELVALITGDPKKAKKLADNYAVPAFHYDDFEQAVEEQKIEAIYIALPNTQHRPFTERAARVGVHVLCEKPMATTEKDCRAMIAACDNAKVHLMIAYRLHFAPAHLQAIALARAGKLGDLRFFSSIFGMQVKSDNIRTDPKDGGGPLRDLGVYCINAARYLFDDEPIEVRAAGLVVVALQAALSTRGSTQNLIFHSDRGSQYGSVVCRELLAKANIQQSMSARANPYDNAFAESFVGTLKGEMLRDGCFESMEDARTEIFEYIEAYYNRIRRHSALDYCAPEVFELQEPQRIADQKRAFPENS